MNNQCESMAFNRIVWISMNAIENQWIFVYSSVEINDMQWNAMWAGGNEWAINENQCTSRKINNILLATTETNETQWTPMKYFENQCTSKGQLTTTMSMRPTRHPTQMCVWSEAVLLQWIICNYVLLYRVCRLIICLSTHDFTNLLKTNLTELNESWSYLI